MYENPNYNNYTAYSNGEINVIFALEIDAYRELQEIQELVDIKYGNSNAPDGIMPFIEGIWSRHQSSKNDLHDASQEQISNGGNDSISSRQAQLNGDNREGPRDTESIARESKSGKITPKMDAEYIVAVERGDMETVQRMIIEAAKLAMPNTKVVDENGNPRIVYHGSPYGGIIVFNHKEGKSTSGLKEFGTYFATNRNLAEMYRDNRKISKDIEQEVTDEIYRLRAIQERFIRIP